MTKSILTLSFLAMVSMPFAAQASLLTGVLNITGTVTISSSMTTPGDIMFVDNVFNVNAPASTQQGSFMTLEGTSGTIKNITNPPDATGTLVTPVTDFMTFNAAPNITFTLTVLLPGVYGAAGCASTPPAALQTCTPSAPDESPFNLFNTSSSSSTASFNVLGTEVDSSTGNTTNFTGAFTTPFTSQNFQTILAEVEGGTPVTTAFSAQFSTVPEPSSLLELMMGMGLVGISVVYRKKLKRT